MLEQAAPIFDLNPELRKEVIAIFLSESANEMAKISTAFEQKEWESIRLSVHKLKGSALMIGAADFASLNSGIEAKYDATQQIVGEEVEHLLNAYQELSEYLSSY